MRPALIAPTGVERRFGDEEIIVTKTDPKGVITYANDVFLRVAAYTEEQAIGAPHNIIRHPDMPRAVFKLMWDTISAGQEFFGYVLNLAGDGAHYWVFAHITPSFDAAGAIIGYHSSRRLPDRRAVATAQDLYRQILEVERAQPHAPQALAAGTELLTTTLAERNETYSEFVWAITPETA